MAQTLTTNRWNLAQALTEAWGNWRRRSVTRRELEGCDDDEIRRIAHDVGLSADSLKSLARYGPDAADLLKLRLRELDLGQTAIETAVMRDMQRCCTTCDSKQECAHEIEDRPKQANWPEYCPNAMTLDALAQSKCCH